MLLETLQIRPDLGQIVAELNRLWAAEQARRHEFWGEISDDVKAEFINGEVIYHSPVRLEHNEVSRNLINILSAFLWKNKLGKLFFEKAMICCTRNDYEPDIIFYGQQKVAQLQPKTTVFPPPDFVVEILSDSTAHRDRGIKLQDYALHQIGEYWIIDAEQQYIEQYILPNESSAYILQKIYHADDLSSSNLILSPIIDGFCIPVKAVFEEEWAGKVCADYYQNP